MIDYGMEADLVWVCFQDDTGECWSWGNKDIRLQENMTLNAIRQKIFENRQKIFEKDQIRENAMSLLKKGST